VSDKEGWELVYDAPYTDGDRVERMPVPNGWIYRSTLWAGSDEAEDCFARTQTQSMAFVPEVTR
jgi:hypothetical protein